MRTRGSGDLGNSAARLSFRGSDIVDALSSAVITEGLNQRVIQIGPGLQHRSRLGVLGTGVCHFWKADRYPIRRQQSPKVMSTERADWTRARDIPAGWSPTSISGEGLTYAWCDRQVLKA